MACVDSSGTVRGAIIRAFRTEESLCRAAKTGFFRGVRQACLTLIRRGDESRIPEMIDLLNLYGNKRLCEDYLNCGQPDLDWAGRRWARARGYHVGTGHGSARATWGARP